MMKTWLNTLRSFKIRVLPCLRTSIETLNFVDPETNNMDDLPSPNGEKRKSEEGVVTSPGKKVQKGGNHPRKKIKLVEAVTDDKSQTFSETSYYFENGLRKVFPYYFKYETHAKGRWWGKPLLDVLSTEFRNWPRAHYAAAVRSGRVRVNGHIVEPDYVVRNNDLLTNCAHRHEMPIADQKIEIVHNDDRLLVINKPASLPVHPCGRYRHNSAIFILGREYGLRGLRSIHRLDRLTSGLLIFAKSQEGANEMMESMKRRDVRKEYVCRVMGHFPSGHVECSQPLSTVNHKIGAVWVRGDEEESKEARTVFEMLSYSADTDTSVVRCLPHTGRTHQIRVHLQYLGHPIINDALYTSSFVWGPGRGRGGEYGGRSREQIVEALLEEHCQDNWIDFRYTEGTPPAPRAGAGDLMVVADAESEVTGCGDTEMRDDGAVTEANTSHSQGETDSAGDSAAEVTSADPGTSDNPATSAPSPTNDSAATPPTSAATDGRVVFGPSSEYYDPTCVECQVRLQDPVEQHLVIYLHALRYSCGTDTGTGTDNTPQWSFETALPEWAKPDWRPSGHTAGIVSE